MAVKHWKCGCHLKSDEYKCIHKQTEYEHKCDLSVNGFPWQVAIASDGWYSLRMMKIGLGQVGMFGDLTNTSGP